MYMHGGGFVTGHAAMYMKCFIALLDSLQGKHGLRAAILSVEYPLGPEAPYPAAIHACVDAYRYLIHTLSVSPTKIVLAGDSAGGALVGTTLHVLANQRDFTEYATLPPLAMPAGSIFLSPWADLRDDVPSYETNRSTDFLSVRGLHGFRAAYLPALAQLDGDQDARDALLADPLVSIRHGKYTGASPVLVAFSKVELLQDGGEMLARQFEAQGVQVDRLCRDDQMHVWINEPTFATSLDLWKQDITRIADWVNDRLI
ncbi:Alpha/Beta hydrolase protein [Gongronella butleri]|nr:Alpha/Beta hydrolase protein [Gongronella butleri]